MTTTTANGSKPPTGERGVTTNAPAITVPGWGALFTDVIEKLPDLRWTGGHGGATAVYQAMLNDAQVEALRAAITLPQRRRRWMIDPNSAPARVTKHVASDLGLPIKGAKTDQPRLIGGFSWQRHLFHVLLAPFMGHYFFEQTGHIDPDTLLWHLDKLAPRPPRTIMQIDVAPDGGLEGIRQYAGQNLTNPELIGVDRLAAYVWDQEAGNWVGRSMLRSIYREWLVKDELLRVLATRDRRNGMGVPIVEAITPEGDQNLAKAQQVVQGWRAGEEASAGFPYGTRPRLLGVEGTLPNILDDIRYQDEAMAKRFLAMFMSLGQGSKTGARALGDTFVEFFALAEDALAEWVCDTTTLHVIADIARWNYGLDPVRDPIPLLVSERVEDPKDDVVDLVNLVNTTDGNGRSLLTVDDETEAWVRQQRGLPERTMGAGQAGAAARSRRTGGSPAAADAGPVKLPDRPVRRDPMDFEVTAAVDFQAMEMSFEDGVDALLREWSDIRAGQVEDLAVAIVAAGGDVEQLAQITAGSAGADVLLARMVAVATDGVAGTLEEAQHQGAPIAEPPGISELTAALEARANAAAQLLAGSLSQAASQRAVAVAGTVLTPEEVADDVRGYIGGLSDSWLRDQFNGLLTQSMGTGRRLTMAASSTITAIYASALLDANVCAPCLEWDGRQFGDLEEAEQQFPTGGNADCQGGPRCRCTLVAIHGESPATVQ